MRRGCGRAGFTITELMVALAVMAFVVSQLLYSYTIQQQNYHEHEDVIETQEEVRLIADQIVSDLRMAGFMVPKIAAVASIDGGTAATDTLCMSDPSFVAEARLAEATSRFASFGLTGAVSSGTTSISLDSATPDVDGDGVVDFVAGRGILITDGTTSHCALIDTISSGDIKFLPGAAADVSIVARDGLAVPAVIYEVSNGQLKRNGVVLSKQVEDLQIQFGVDDDDDGKFTGAEFPIDSLNTGGHSLERLYSARVILTAHSARPEAGFVGGRLAAANRIAGSADEFKRRRVSVDTYLRNTR